MISFLLLQHYKFNMKALSIKQKICEIFMLSLGNDMGTKFRATYT